MSRLFMAAAMLSAAIAAGGCVENQPARPASAEAVQASAAAPAKTHAECLVCKHENDLACVDLTVDDKTPRTTIDGKEYFFCSEACKKLLIKNPQKYLGQK
jgi:YHS domain-containing protein